MFSDPIVSVMSMLLLCFAGIIIMFVFFVRSLSKQGEEMRENFRKQQMFLTDLERQFMELGFLLRRIQGSEPGQTVAAGEAVDGASSLLRKSDDLMSMLEVNARKQGFDDHLLPPLATRRQNQEEYDPASDPHLFEDSLLSGAGKGGMANAGSKPERSSRGRSHSSFSITLDD